jgi:hypothetical protein
MLPRLENLPEEQVLRYCSLEIGVGDFGRLVEDGSLILALIYF